MEEELSFPPVKEPPVPHHQRVHVVSATEGMAEISPDVPLKWRMVDESMWPYMDYKDEFLRSPYRLDAHTLAQRWEGLYDTAEVLGFMAWPGVEQDRWAAQNTYGEIDVLEVRLRWNKLWEQRFNDLMEVASQKLLTGNISARERDALSKQVDRYFHMIRLLRGESTSIEEKRNGVQVNLTVQQLLVEGMKNLTPEDQAILGHGLGGVRLVPLEDAAEKVGGRTFDALPVHRATNER